MRMLVATTALMLSLGVLPAAGQIPQTISYQGVLTDAAGVAVPDGPRNLTFKIYNAASGGSALWTEVQAAAPITRGAFAVILGSNTPLTLPFDVPYWLGTAVELDAELAPRVPLASSPYSLNARSLVLPFSATASAAGTSAVLSITNDGTGRAVAGTTTSTAVSAYGLHGQVSSLTPGVTSAGVRGVNNGTGSAGYGVDGSHAGAGSGVRGYAPSGIGVFGQSISGTGVYGASTTGSAGFFQGNVTVTGTLTKGAGAFKIDHPLDPRNRYLYHSFVESPDMKNIYDGVAMLDARGEAWIVLPEWFEALNRDFRYQLTAIGAPGPRLHVARKVHSSRFKIAGGEPGMEVSWQLTGIRQDPTANAHRIPVEEPKAPADRGRYLDPQAFGQPPERGIGRMPGAERDSLPRAALVRPRTSLR
jgi:hypothetical protein